MITASAFNKLCNPVAILNRASRKYNCMNINKSAKCYQELKIKNILYGNSVAGVCY
ncbi:hypothetical protein RINTHH_15660 [Richelia intracellularis HH01]|uniref:Uncharacterized protein n=1 Tax=Richelia intracellularis HH01 TaxID=1165094 RepID=M1X5Z6_9NOST|nr:hypothetical protein RINTHH_15660 [Richelia intracellularis HH01]